MQHLRVRDFQSVGGPTSGSIQTSRVGPGVAPATPEAPAPAAEPATVAIAGDSGQVQASQVPTASPHANVDYAAAAARAREALAPVEVAQLAVPEPGAAFQDAFKHPLACEADVAQQPAYQAAHLACTAGTGALLDGDPARMVQHLEVARAELAKLPAGEAGRVQAQVDLYLAIGYQKQGRPDLASQALDRVQADITAFAAAHPGDRSAAVSQAVFEQAIAVQRSPAPPPSAPAPVARPAPAQDPALAAQAQQVAQLCQQAQLSLTAGNLAQASSQTEQGLRLCQEAIGRCPQGTPMANNLGQLYKQLVTLQQQILQGQLPRFEP